MRDIDRTLPIARFNRACMIAVSMSTAMTIGWAGELMPPTAGEPIAAILAAFRTHDIVALGEGPHGNLEGHAFRVMLARDPRFAATVNDIVVEFGSSRFQGVHGPICRW